MFFHVVGVHDPKDSHQSTHDSTSYYWVILAFLLIGKLNINFQFYYGFVETVEELRPHFHGSCAMVGGYW